jgi:hypothetical protein
VSQVPAPALRVRLLDGRPGTLKFKFSATEQLGSLRTCSGPTPSQLEAEGPVLTRDRDSDSKAAHCQGSARAQPGPGRAGATRNFSEGTRRLTPADSESEPKALARPGRLITGPGPARARPAAGRRPAPGPVTVRGGTARAAKSRIMSRVTVTAALRLTRTLSGSGS